MAKKPVKEDARSCCVQGCDRPHHARGYCQQHYDEFRKKNRNSDKTGNSSDRKVCSVPGCNRFHHARGYCKMHYAKIVKGGTSGGNSRNVSPTTPIILPSPETDPEGFRDKRLLLIRQRHRLILKKKKVNQPTA